MIPARVGSRPTGYAHPCSQRRASGAGQFKVIIDHVDTERAG
jgi:hypothetical protein